jgi:hypothetical protein
MTRRSIARLSASAPSNHTQFSVAFTTNIENIIFGTHRARHFYDLLSCKEKGPKKLASVFNSQVRESLVRAYGRDGGQPLLADYDFGVLNQWIGQAELAADPARGVHLKIAANNLIGALWWQLGQKLAGSTNIQTCRHCSALFETGPGTGRHLDATFCCDEHKVKYFSLARTKRKQAGRRHLNNRLR